MPRQLRLALGGSRGTHGWRIMRRGPPGPRGDDDLLWRSHSPASPPRSRRPHPPSWRWARWRGAAGAGTVPVDLISIGHWLRLLLGAPVTTGSTNFIHTFGLGVASLPSNVKEIGYPDIPSFDVCTGDRTDTLDMDYSRSGAATATLGLLGQGSLRAGATSGGTPTSAATSAELAWPWGQ
ncbi:phage tail tube protein [Falsiroseomonas sp. E2-1-a4]|uniref:phage tail tube protein n=1 Tax=Falsiroseomonas sp. E2-1-a4 TaxID=3239299 RepID=UPI003F378861